MNVKKEYKKIMRKKKFLWLAIMIFLYNTNFQYTCEDITQPISFEVFLVAIIILQITHKIRNKYF
jgi:hypothetical protein